MINDHCGSPEKHREHHPNSYFGHYCLEWDDLYICEWCDEIESCECDIRIDLDEIDVIDISELIKHHRESVRKPYEDELQKLATVVDDMSHDILCNLSSPPDERYVDGCTCYKGDLEELLDPF